MDADDFDAAERPLRVRIMGQGSLGGLGGAQKGRALGARVVVVAAVFQRVIAVKGSKAPNVQEHAPLSAGASVDHGVEVETTREHVNRAADRDCCVSSCWLLYFLDAASRIACSMLSPMSSY
jgi:hypothetical protein